MRNVRLGFRFVGRSFGGRSSSRGSTLLWMIGALVVLGAVGASVVLMSPSATRGKLEQEAGMRAYYNANAGLQFLYSMGDAAQNSNINFTNYTSLMGNGSVVTYTLPNNGTFSYQLGNIVNNGVNGTYQITNLIGTVEDTKGGNAYSYAIYGGGKGNSDVKEYTISGGTNTNTNVPKGTYTNSIVFGSGGNYTGDFITTSATMASGMILNGSIDYIGTSSSYSDGCFHTTGNQIGNTDGSSHLCSNTCIVIDGGGKYYGNIYAQGNVTVSNGTVIGNIYSGGNVVLTWSSHITGTIYTNGTLTFNNKVYTSATVDQIPTSILNGTVQFNSGVPAKCATYTLPTHEYYSGKAAYNLAYAASNNWTGEDTIYGSSDLSDHSHEYSSFTLNSGTKLCLDLSGSHTYINIFISGNLSIYGKIYIKTIEGEECIQDKNLVTKNNYSNFAYSSYASKVYFDVNGTSYFTGGTTFFGTLYSKGDITFNGDAFIGAMYTNGTMYSNGGVGSYFVSSDYANANW